MTDDCGAVIGNKVFFPKRGDIILFRPNEIHFGRFPKSSKYKFLTFLIPVDFFDKNFQNSKTLLSPFLDESEKKTNLVTLPADCKDKVLDIADELFSIMENDDNYPSCDAVIFAKLVKVLEICNKHYSLQKNTTNTSKVPPLIAKTMQKINADFPHYTGLDDLAKHNGCSVTYLTQTFKQYMGKSIHNYLTERRLEHARRLLKNGLSVTESCYQSGFTDCSRFIMIFKKQFHTTPGQYKKER